ncbi:hypothetical protein [Halobacteriovorax sp. DA5]|uniref:hypothetical protein n=1 Tax=Halobacteriovorax sp. DA5 TaxID=2067553 RepID=UPI000CD2845D|nr:hypothetical protein [Halobacteriovorax sp. DA5]POB14799.1 hypothetical protein C0Z22_00060 [Halobacteriovorax sp. DA5]
MSKKTKIEINQKDVDFFFYLHSVKASRTDQIGRDAYPHLGRWALYKRLQRLEQTGLIQGQISASSNYKKVFSITRKAFKRYLSSTDVKRKELKSDAIKHDTGLVDIRHAFLRVERVSKFIPENSLQTWPSTYFGEEITPFIECGSDGVIEVTIGDRSVFLAVEYELSLKSNVRYQDLVAKYYSKGQVPRVLYIVETQTDLDKIMSIEKQADKKERAKFFYTTFDKLVQKQVVKFKNWKGEVMSL